MRLIDADKMIELLSEVIECLPSDYQGEELKIMIRCYEDCKTAVEIEPTAYDVDKVVEAIEEFGECTECRKNGTDKRFYYGMGCKACAFGKILNIVKQGGVE